ncbi:MAG: glycosyltransferase [Nanoarchaeota archaeon]|nr:glycosyltransferase [Nanoarchaeota archaeon]
MTPQEIALFVYNLTLFPIILFSVMFLTLSLINLFIDKKEPAPRPTTTRFPFVSIQIPTFNDPIALRCVRRCMQMDYPKDRYEIIIVDDSTSRETQERLNALADGKFVKFVHRENRDGFKPGALKKAMKQTLGEIIAIFDADWIPHKDYLKEVVGPFSDPKVAVVQTRQGFYNHKTNLITRFAAYVLMSYHSIMMPINNRINCVFFCGTGGAFRRSIFDEVGGWNLDSITEDSDLTVRMLVKGYKTVYLELEHMSEVPDTFESFIKQQMRWCYGNARVFFDNASSILFKSGLTIWQRLMITFITVGNVIAPLVLLMTFFGLLGWFLGDPSLFMINDLFSVSVRFLVTGGFIFMGFITLYKRGRIRELPHYILAAFSMGLLLAIWNTFAFTRAIFNKKLHWYCTPKAANTQILKNAS